MPRPIKRQLPDGKWIVENDFNIWRQRYWSLFHATAEGRLIFNDMLTELGYYKTIETEEDRHLHNFAKRLISWCGNLDMLIKEPMPVVLDQNGNPVQPTLKGDKK